MLKLAATETAISKSSYKFQALAGKIMKLFSSVSTIKFFSEDTVYKWYFIKFYIPELYKQHITEQTANCIFCANLTNSGCSRHCLKCSAGTYIHGSPLLPGTLHSYSSYPDNSDASDVPWYYKKTCDHFIRLSQRSYLRNFGSILSSSGIYNYEVLEGVEKGLSAGEKPCHVCASTNYDIYKKCSSQKGFDPYSPCHKIRDELLKYYNENA